MFPDPSKNDCIVLNDSDKESIREQVNRLLASPYFNQSRRSVTFLRFIIDHTLAGDAEKIKERVLGIEIFGRDADYDTASDPVVRVTASEIRKRVAQYYQEPGHQDEVRITLPSGSYVPRFHWPKDRNDDGLHSAGTRSEPPLASPAALGADELTAAHTGEPLFSAPEMEPASDKPTARIEVQSETQAASGTRRFALVVALICAVVGLVWVTVTFLGHGFHDSAFDFFWRPVLSASDPVLLCIADQVQDSGFAFHDPTEPARLVWLNDSLKKNSFSTVAIDDLDAIVKVAGILQSSRKRYTIKGQGATSLADLRSGPTIFVGAMDNAWTLRLTNALRYHFSSNSDMTQFRIIDSTAPTQTRWVVDRSTQAAVGTYRDYAIAARFTDVNTGKPAIILAGIGRCATLAAGEFLTDSGDLSQLERAAKAAGNKTNMEIVLSTQVIDGQPGSPKIEAAYFW
jgi:hypothetical protein